MKHTLRTTGFMGGMLLLSQIGLSSHVSAQTLPVPSHIVILFEENYAETQIIGCSSAPHINALATDPNAALFTNFYAIEHPSQPNYLDIFSGGDQGMTSDDLPSTDLPSTEYPFTSPNLCKELQNAGKTFITYSEDLPSVGYDGVSYTTGSANYARKHNPCTNWVGTGTNQFANTVNQPFTAFPNSTSYSSLPTVSFVVPNMTNDMHDYTCADLPCPESIVLGDNWMYTNLDSLRAWSLANNTLYIVIYDEDDDNHNNNIPVIFYGPMVKHGTYTQTINHFNLLRTIEQMYGLTYAGAAADSSVITGVWLTTTAVNNVTNNNYQFKVMPNPASDVINFNCNNALTSKATVTIADETGRIAGKYSMTGTDLQVNTSAFAAGVYFYSITNESGNKLDEGKIVITHN